MAPVTPVGVRTQTLAEALAGLSLTQPIRQVAPAVLGSFASSMSLQPGAPTFGTPEPTLVLYGMAALARTLTLQARPAGARWASHPRGEHAPHERSHTPVHTAPRPVHSV